MVVQSDKSVLLEVDNPQYAEARDALARFAELEKSPEHIHTYRLSPLSLWNAAASGLTADAIVEALTRFSKYDVPGNITADVRDYVSRFGRLKLRRDEAGGLLLYAEDPLLMLEISRQRKVRQFIIEDIDSHTVRVNAAMRGHVKKALVDLGYPAEDLAGYVDGAPLSILLRPVTLGDGQPFGLRHYQEDAVAVFHADGAGAGRLRGDRAALRRGQNDGGHGRDGAPPDEHADPDDEHGRRPPMDRRVARQNQPRRRRHRRVYRRQQGDQAGHDRHLPDPHVSQAAPTSRRGRRFVR